MAFQSAHFAPRSLRLHGATACQQRSPARLGLLGVLLALLAHSAMAQSPSQASTPPSAERQQELVRMVRQDCGSCHGLHLTGGLGSALTPAALAGKPLDSMVSTIYRGRPGTPMAPWSGLLSEADALWIAQQLFAGFPEQPTTPPSANAKDQSP